MRIKNIIIATGALLLLMLSTGCEKTKSYSELLRDEERACNWYLAQHEIEVSVPKDSVFKVGEDAPFYKMDGDGNVYMRVIKDGDRSKMPKKGDRVYFSFLRQNIEMLMQGTWDKDFWDGNADNMAVGSCSFILGETTMTSSTKYGTGIQLPVTYLGYYSEVEVVIKSLEGFVDRDQNNCVPYIYKVRYFPALY